MSVRYINVSVSVGSFAMPMSGVTCITVCPTFLIMYCCGYCCMSVSYLNVSVFVASLIMSVSDVCITGGYHHSHVCVRCECFTMATHFMSASDVNVLL